MTPAGSKNKRITIQSKTVTYVDGYKVEAWATVFSPMAAVRTVGSREVYNAQKSNAETTTLFIIGYKSGITSAMRILYGTRTFEIIGIPNNINEANVELHVSAKEVVPGG